MRFVSMDIDGSPWALETPGNICSCIIAGKQAFGRKLQWCFWLLQDMKNAARGGIGWVEKPLWFDIWMQFGAGISDLSGCEKL